MTALPRAETHLRRFRARQTSSLWPPAAITANATNFTPAAYQWHLNNFEIPGATGVTYTVANATAATDAGAYSVATKTPASETVLSAAFTVTVNTSGESGNNSSGSGGGGGGGGAPSFLWLGAVVALLALRGAKGKPWLLEFHHADTRRSGGIRHE